MCHCTLFLKDSLHIIVCMDGKVSTHWQMMTKKMLLPCRKLNGGQGSKPKLMCAEDGCIGQAQNTINENNTIE
uniref:Uncharacterized protein n=1 Tax=Arion vulgaris TaxID=1028688 RepID=A0A0B6ZU48_9EUPU